MARVSNRLKEYLRLKNDGSYVDVRYNPLNNGLMATHVLHVFHPKRGHYEQQVIQALFANGDKIILGKELAAPGEQVIAGRKHADGSYNDRSCEIASVTGLGKNTVRRAMEHCLSKDAKVAIIHFPEASAYSEERMHTGIAMFNGLHKYRFAELVIVIESKVQKKSHP